MKILLIDDHILFREGLASLLDAQPDFDVVGSSNSVQDAIALTNKLHPDLVLMDFDLPDGSGLEFTRSILGQQILTKVVFLMMQDDDVTKLDTIEGDSVSYLPKNIPVADLLDYIRGLKRGETTFSRSKIDS